LLKWILFCTHALVNVCFPAGQPQSDFYFVLYLGTSEALSFRENFKEFVQKYFINLPTFITVLILKWFSRSVEKEQFKVIIILAQYQNFKQ
jgi:hypothetical protein